MQSRADPAPLQATHGVVSGEPEFFKRAFGRSYSEFEEILLRPPHFIFNRDWFETLDGRPEFDEYRSHIKKLDACARQELLARLSSCDPSRYPVLLERETDPLLRAALRFYVPIPKHQEQEIWRKQKVLAARRADLCSMPEEDRVEDAGLDDDAAIVPLPRPAAHSGGPYA